MSIPRGRKDESQITKEEEKKNDTPRFRFAARIFALLSDSAHWVYSVNAISGTSGPQGDIYNDK